MRSTLDGMGARWVTRSNEEAHRAIGGELSDDGGATDGDSPRPPENEEQPHPSEAVIPRLSRDERGIGWGDDPRAGDRDREWYLRERPPHHE
jgi:hypothetical protein